MAEIIKRAQIVESESYARAFAWRDRPNAGFGFPCDANGVVQIDPENTTALDNYRKCLDGTYDVIDQGIEVYRNRHREPALLRCDCGNKVWLYDPMTNECDRCGRLYNGGGQSLRPRSQWEEREDDFDGFANLVALRRSGWRR